MTIEKLEQLLNTNGKFNSIKYERTCATYKGVEDTILKATDVHSVAVGRVYDNMQSTKDGRENGTLPEENAGLKGFEWVKFPVFLKSIRTGKMYLRIETSKNTKFATRYYENGVEVKKEDIMDQLTAKEKNHNGDMPTVMNIPVDSIISVN